MGALSSMNDVVKLAIAEGFHRLRRLADIGEWRGHAGGNERDHRRPRRPLALSDHIHAGTARAGREMTMEVIDLGDTFELNSMLRELEELWPKRAEHLDRVEEILEYLEDKVQQLVTGSPELLDADQRAAWVKLRARQLATIQPGPG